MRPMSPSTEASASELEPRLRLRSLRGVIVALGVANLCLILLGLYLLDAVLPACSGEVKLPFSVISLVSILKLICTGGAGRAQLATAETIAGHPTGGSPTAAAAMRHQRRMRYRRWLWWARLGMGVTILQFISALYLMFVMVKDFSYDGSAKECYLGPDTKSRGRKRICIAVYMVLAWLVAIVQCFTGSDVLRWRSFYATHDTAWKAHYLEVFDHGIREALCCMGRVRYLSVLEEDEVYSVARLLGDLVAYRASGTGHLEFLAGLALLQKHKQPPKTSSDLAEAPESCIKEAFSYHPFAEAAYTGPLLDFGRNPVLFPCAWLYRQGVLTPWTRNRRPILEGDNWWRGHAAAFLKYVNLHPDVLRKGRVSQRKREAAYFVVVLHHLRSVVIAVRGTETPEDLLTDGLCRECPLTVEDLDGLINGHLSQELRQKVCSSFPHYGHSGIIHSARELFMQLDGQPEGQDSYQSKNSGLLSSLLGDGQECHGYKVIIVGHSLGGSVAALLGIRLYARYPNLHVYCYGALPCVNLVVAEACSDFVTSIIYNDEFSARLSINSILRLRADAITALSDDSSADSAIISKLARRILQTNKQNDTAENANPFHASTAKPQDSRLVYRKNLKYTAKGGVFLCAHAVCCIVNMANPCPSTMSVTESSRLSQDIKFRCKDVSDARASAVVAGGGESSQENTHEGSSLFNNLSSEAENKGDEIVDRAILDDDFYDYRSSNARCSDVVPGPQFEESMASLDNDMSPPPSMVEIPEVFLPGLVIHIVPDQRSIFPSWSSWGTQEKNCHRAFLAERDNFKDIIVTPFMFLDHLPWRCHYAMQKVLETRKAEGQLGEDLLDGYQIV